MIPPVRPIDPPATVDAVHHAGEVSPSAREGFAFGEALERAVDRLASVQSAARAKTDQFLRGEEPELHEVILAGQRAELAFEYFLQVRNKIVQAYQEVMRMQI